MNQPLLSIRHLSKRFGGIQALDDVSLDIKYGEVLGLMGENGAGKSTLMRIICGIEQLDEGQLVFEGAPIGSLSPKVAQNLGIGMIPQELLLADSMSVVENMFLGYELHSSFGRVDSQAMNKRAGELLERLGCSDIDPETELGEIPKASQQMTAIARRIIQGGKLFIMDEPTSALTEYETQRLFTVIRSLCQEGFSVIFISHRLEEVLTICDRFAILRDGKMVNTIENAEGITKQDLITPMIGSMLEQEYPHQQVEWGKPLLDCENLSYRSSTGRLISDISFTLHEGEVIGFTGLVGMGKSELARTLFGMNRKEGGIIKVGTQEVSHIDPVSASNHGIGFVTEDRRNEGLILCMRTLFNMTLRSLGQLSKVGWIRTRKEREAGERLADKLSMKRPYLDLEVRNLSGGNQQKVLIARQLLGDARIILFDEPTKGIDIGAKAEIARLINQMSHQAKGVCLFSSEPREVLGLCDTIYVLHQHGCEGPFKRGELDYHTLMTIEFGGSV